jgi:hypothetical protein
VPKVDGERGCVLARMEMKCRSNVWIARSALLDRFVCGGSDIVGDEVLLQSFGSFVVHDLKPDEMAELGEPLVGAGICVDNGCFGSTG